MGQKSKVYYDASRERLYVDGLDIYIGVGVATGATDKRGYSVVPRGTAALPSVSFRLAASPFTASPTTGLYAPAADQVAVSCATTQIMLWTAAGATLASGVYLLPDGAVGAPSLSFTNSPTTGLYRVGADEIGVSTAGVLRWSVTATGDLLAATGNQILALGGTAAAPDYSFSGDPNTGICAVGADSIGFSTNGTLRWYFDATGILTAAAAGTTLSLNDGIVTGMRSLMVDEAPAAGHTMAGTLTLTIATITEAVAGLVAADHVIVTPRSSTANGALSLWWVDRSVDGQFTITSDVAPTAPVVFDYLIIKAG